jgi:BTB/POZ domain-containing protein 16
MMRIMTAEGPRSGECINSLKSTQHSTTCSAKCNTSRKQWTIANTPVFNADGKLNQQFTAKIYDVFDNISRSYGTVKDPDVVLSCVGMKWKLHLPYLQKSDTLYQLFSQTKSYGPNPDHDGGQSSYEKVNDRMPMKYTNDVDEDVRLHASWHTKAGRDVSLCPSITLNIENPLVTPYAVAVVLGNLYRGEFQLPSTDLHTILLAAYYLGYSELQNTCAQSMINGINATTVVYYHTAAVKCHEKELQQKCERWLELRLVPELCTSIHLKHLTKDAMYTTLISPRLFIYNEFELLKVLVCWTFLQLNTSIQQLPTYTTVLTYFASSSKSGPFLGRDEGLPYLELFRTLHLLGITNNVHIHEMQMMNILPQRWIVKLLTGHYNAVNTGGDMSLTSNFSQNAIRTGFVIGSDPEKSEVVSLFGFHFELKAEKDKQCSGSYNFYIQRLKPMDPALSMHDSERQTFSMRPERLLQYSISVQSTDNYQHSGMLVHRFGLGVKTSSSKVISWQNLTPPLYVTYSMLLPPS